jgi:hydrogenase maturation factor HypE
MAPTRPAIRHPSGVRTGLLIVGLAGVGALVAATFTTVIRITVGTTTRLASLDTELSGWDRHGPALLVIAGFALLMLAGAYGRGARPAMAAVAVCGAAALVVALGSDLHHLDDTGQVGRLYDDASAGAAAGFWLEVAGGVLLLGAGLGGLLLARGRAERTTRAPVAAGAGEHS